MTRLLHHPDTTIHTRHVRYELDRIDRTHLPAPHHTELHSPWKSQARPTSRAVLRSCAFTVELAFLREVCRLQIARVRCTLGSFELPTSSGALAAFNALRTPVHRKGAVQVIADHSL